MTKRCLAAYRWRSLLEVDPPTAEVVQAELSAGARHGALELALVDRPAGQLEEGWGVGPVRVGQLGAGEDGGDQGAKRRRVERLLQEVDGAQAHRLDGRRQRAVAGDDRHRRPHPPLAHLPEGGQAVLIGELESSRIRPKAPAASSALPS